MEGSIAPSTSRQGLHQGLVVWVIAKGDVW